MAWIVGCDVGRTLTGVLVPEEGAVGSRNHRRLATAARDACLQPVTTGDPTALGMTARDAGVSPG